MKNKHDYYYFVRLGNINSLGNMNSLNSINRIGKIGSLGNMKFQIKFLRENPTTVETQPAVDVQVVEVPTIR